jgi:dihydrofolate synthase/folylpolyglutamate synthase
MNYSEAIQFLYGLRLFGAKFGLENTFQLAALAGNPQDRLRFIHVAGTNGKGSTCAMLESIYRAAGLRTGLFTSPHLVSFRERIQVNRQFIGEQDVVRLTEELRKQSSEFRLQAAWGPAKAGTPNQDARPTFFEFITVMALKFFAEQKCDLVIWETGLGGRLDATNIVTPLASVITNIQFDHQQWLGDTLEKIAAEKAGIIKPGVPVITTVDEPKALAVIEKTAREKNAPLVNFNSWEGRRAAVPNQNQSGSPARRPSPIAKLPLTGEHQKINAALALATVETLQSKIPVSEAAIRTGLETVNWPGRLQLVQTESGQDILLDGAHNVAGAKALREALSSGTLKRELNRAGSETGAPQKCTLILGVLQDKDWPHICETLAPMAAQIFTVPVASERTADARELAAACRAANSAAKIAVCDSLREALKGLHCFSVRGIGRADLPVGLDAGQRVPSSEPLIVVTGSLYLVGEALELLGLSPATGNERALNEWSAHPQIVAHDRIG